MLFGRALPTGLAAFAAASALAFVSACDSAGAGSTKKGEPCASPDATTDPTGDPGHMLSYTRLLRRVELTLIGKTPSYDDYQRVVQAPDDSARETMIDQAIEDALQSKDFYRALLSFGHDYLKTGSYVRGGLNMGDWIGHEMAMMDQCPSDSHHPGDWYIQGATEPEWGDPESYCYDQARDGRHYDPPHRMIEPWWDPGHTVGILGRAGSGVRSHDGIDCGYITVALHGTALSDDAANPLCSCGPNLVYCMPRQINGMGSMQGLPGEHGYGSNDEEASQRRQVWEEPARLFAHIGWNDRPLSDLVLGNYSVAPLALQALYVRTGRRNSANAALDDLKWWNPSEWQGPADPEHDVKDPLAWRQFVVETLNPNLLSLTADKAPSGSLDRTYTFDPRVEDGQPLGIGAAGVLTAMGSLSTYARERVRAARFLETFACMTFAPPPPDVQFPPFQRDPATEGQCQHCHAIMDLAAIHFKRWDFDSLVNIPVMGGVGPWTWQANDVNEPWARWQLAFISNTKLTPVTDDQIAQRPDSRLIDFLPPEESLFGVTSDGTIGPLGLGKILVRSGQFDSCAVQRLYEHFVGRKIDPAVETPFIRDLTQHFVADNRALRPFIRYMLHSDQFRRGL